MPDFAVKTAFSATDRVSPAFRRMGVASRTFGNTAQNSFRRASSGASMFGGMMKRILPLVGGAALLRFANRSIDAWKKQESAVANVNAGLKSTNNAIGISSDQLLKMAASWQRVGIFADEDILQNVTAQLLTFGSIGKENFDRMQAASMDITAKLYGVTASGEQLRDVTIMLGKAMDDPVKGMTALRRRGIQFNEQQTQMIKNIYATQGRLAAQNKLLEEVEKLYGGVNKELAKTSAGMEKAAEMRLGDVMETAGKQLIPLRIQFYELANYILPKLVAVLPYIIGFVKQIAPLVLAAVGAFLAYKLAIWSTIIAQQIMIAVDWIKYLWMMREFINVVTIKQWLWNAAMSANPLGIVIIAVAALVYFIRYLIKNWDSFGKSISMSQGPIGKIVSFFKTIYDKWVAIKKAFTTEGMIAGLKKLGSAILEAFNPFSGLLDKTEALKAGKAPNQTNAEMVAGNTTVNINNRNVETKASVSPRQGAKINYAAMGAQ